VRHGGEEIVLQLVCPFQTFIGFLQVFRPLPHPPVELVVYSSYFILRLLTFLDLLFELPVLDHQLSVALFNPAFEVFTGLSQLTDEVDHDITDDGSIDEGSDESGPQEVRVQVTDQQKAQNNADQLRENDCSNDDETEQVACSHGHE